ncbi:Gfo/Idh/MocA family oxidoreductase [Thermodesulfovibrio sp. 3462-1]|uniref:Gfo/Idh/MocA family oxidoreductase n=1 Tax=Thermodesulfovibrio obliviosus TaxID=3118332 RepID=A0AAU8H3B5_9BACT
MKFKVAVIGAGYFGQRHIKMLTQMPDVEIVGIVDKDVEKAKEVAQQYKLKYYVDYADLLKFTPIFFVVTPTITHFDIGMDLIKHGKAIFIEKPLTGRPVFAEMLLDEAKKRDVIIQAGLIERYNPVVKTFFEHLKEPFFIQTKRVSPFVGRATDTDVTYDLMIHDLDLIWMMLKKSGDFELTDIKVFTQSIITSRIDYASVWMEFETQKGITKAHLTASRVSSEFCREISAVQQNSVIYADLINKKLKEVDKDGKINEIPVHNVDSHPLYEEIRDFLNSVKQKKFSQQAASPQEIIEVLKIIDKINEGR